MRSKFELHLANGPLKYLPYEQCKISYKVKKSATYTPDWHVDIDGCRYYIEAKGRFQKRNWEPYKYLHVRKSLSTFEELVFLFQNPYVPMPGAKERKDGSKQTHAEWAEKNNFTWYTINTIEELLK